MTNGKGTPTTNERSRPTLAGAVWVRIGRDTNARWPEWKRRWLVLADGTVLVPSEISRDRCTETASEKDLLFSFLSNSFSPFPRTPCGERHSGRRRIRDLQRPRVGGFRVCGRPPPRRRGGGVAGRR